MTTTVTSLPVVGVNGDLDVAGNLTVAGESIAQVIAGQVATTIAAQVTQVVAAEVARQVATLVAQALQQASQNVTPAA